jgi:hypothetical protein
LLVVAFVTGCGGGGGTPSSRVPPSHREPTTTATPAPTVPAAPDFLSGAYACSLVQQQEVTAAFGRPAKPPEPNGGRLFAFDGGDTTNCRVESVDGALVVQYTIFRGHTMDVTQKHWAPIKAQPTLEVVPGVGDGAGYLAEVHTVYALHLFETLELMVVDIGNTGLDLKQAGIALAKVIAPRMGSNASSTAECAVGADGLVPPGQRLSADDLAFEANKDTGRYAGTWKNDTFGTSGAVTADVSFDLAARSVTIKFQFTGDTLGISGAGPSGIAVIEVDRPVAHVHSSPLGDLVITRPLGRACPQHPTSVTADHPPDTSVSRATASIAPGTNVIQATFAITYPNAKTSTGTFKLTHQ